MPRRTQRVGTATVLWRVSGIRAPISALAAEALAVGAPLVPAPHEVRHVRVEDARLPLVGRAWRGLLEVLVAVVGAGARQRRYSRSTCRYANLRDDHRGGVSLSRLLDSVKLLYE